MTPTTLNPTQQSANTIAENAMVLRLSFGKLGNTKKIPKGVIEITDQGTGQIDTSIDKKRVRASKQLLESAELEAIQKFDRATDAWVKEICLPNPFGDGFHLISYEAVDKVEEYLVGRSSTRQNLVTAFVNA